MWTRVVSTRIGPGSCFAVFGAPRPVLQAEEKSIRGEKQKKRCRPRLLGRKVAKGMHIDRIHGFVRISKCLSSNG